MATDLAPHGELSLEFLAAIVENSDDAIVSKDLNGKILSWNDAATKMYGYSTEEALGQSIEIVIPDDRLAEELEIREQIAAGQRVTHLETVRRRRDGTLVEISFSISPVKDQAGRIIAAAGFARDITERNRVAEEQQRLATIVQNSDAAVVSKDLDGKILYWNDAATEMYGYTAEQAIGQPIELVIPENLRQEELEIRSKIAAGEAFHQYETARQRADGTIIDVALSISPVKNAAGEIIGAAGFARDITQTRLLKTLADVVVNSDDAIVVKNIDTHIIEFWNRAAEDLYGYTEAEALGQPIDILIPPELQAEDRAVRARIREGDLIPHHETVRRHKDGHPIDVSLSISPLRDGTGRVVAAARLARDITAKKRLENESARAMGLLERFVDFTAHDFKGPMHHASLSAQEARRVLDEAGAFEPTDPARKELNHLLGLVIANTDWMVKRTEGLLKIVSLDNPNASRRLVDANRAFDDAVAMLRSVYDIVEDADVARDDLPKPQSDFDLLCFLFQNLVHNACKYRRPEDRAEVRATAKLQTDGSVIYSVIDNGIGIKPGLEERIFEVYARDPDNRSVAGHGIGLHFCRLITQWHGGRIWVEPADGGIGSAFNFTLPA